MQNSNPPAEAFHLYCQRCHLQNRAQINKLKMLSQESEPVKDRSPGDSSRQSACTNPGEEKDWINNNLLQHVISMGKKGWRARG
ncbi:hypothetical protein EYF80_021032 [Liparis tanakae]|uniref:Uncharacterized protein n=1 Tax=Liparis tanakae TaxID=230148 RepID=A0A4Z2HST7_9TELE|nr:hypothetical protein EYF80_021032 [Liparis tanakae]